MRTRFDIVLIAPIGDSCSRRPVNVRVGIRVERDARRLPDAQRDDVGLIDLARARASPTDR